MKLVDIAHTADGSWRPGCEVHHMNNRFLPLSAVLFVSLAVKSHAETISLLCLDPNNAQFAIEVSEHDIIINQLVVNGLQKNSIMITSDFISFNVAVASHNSFTEWKINRNTGQYLAGEYDLANGEKGQFIDNAIGWCKKSSSLF